MDMSQPLTEREITLVQQIGKMDATLDLYSRIILALVVRCGGAVKLENRELHYTDQHYVMEKNIRTDDLTVDITINARLK